MDCTQPACWGFVSSHAANIAAAATVIAFRYPVQVVWLIPLVGSVCFSRLFLHDHFPLDVIGGIILGLAIGSLVSRLSNRIITIKAADKSVGGAL